MTEEIIPFADGSTARLRAADTVHHVPSGEEWVVLCDTGTMIAWAGWPPGMARREDFRPQSRASDTAHRDLIDQIRNGQHSLREIILRHNGSPLSN